MKMFSDTIFMSGTSSAPGVLGLKVRVPLDRLLVGDKTNAREKRLDTVIEMGAAQHIARCTLAATAAFIDGSTQTKRYRVEPMAA